MRVMRVHMRHVHDRMIVLCGVACGCVVSHDEGPSLSGYTALQVILQNEVTATRFIACPRPSFDALFHFPEACVRAPACEDVGVLEHPCASLEHSRYRGLIL